MCSIPCRVSCFASVDLKEKDEFNRFFQIDRGKTDIARQMLPPKQTRRPLPCLLIVAFFYALSIQSRVVAMCASRNVKKLSQAQL